MFKRRRKLLFGIAALLLAFILWAVWPENEPPEPTYKGKKLSKWLEGYRTGSALDRQATDEAIRQIGTVGHTLLLKWLQYEPSMMRRFVQPVINSIAGEINHRWEWKDKQAARSMFAYFVLRDLGPDAREVAPEVFRILNSKPSSRLAEHGIRILGAAGTNSLPFLVAAMTNNLPYVRYVAIVELTRMHVEERNHQAKQMTANAATPALQVACSDASAQVREAATGAISVIRLGVITNTPAR